jgi:hypothetical protein
LVSMVRQSYPDLAPVTTPTPEVSSVVEEVREGLWNTNIHETFMLARVMAADLRFN